MGLGVQIRGAGLGPGWGEEPGPHWFLSDEHECPPDNFEIS